DADGCVLVSPDNDLLLALGQDLPAKRLRPEPGQAGQVVSVDDDVVKSDRHTDSLQDTRESSPRTSTLLAADWMGQGEPRSACGRGWRTAGDTSRSPSLVQLGNASAGLRQRHPLSHRPDERRAAHSWSRMDMSTSSYQRSSCSTDSRRRPSSTNP